MLPFEGRCEKRFRRDRLFLPQVHISLMGGNLACCLQVTASPRTVPWNSATAGYMDPWAYTVKHNAHVSYHWSPPLLLSRETLCPTSASHSFRAPIWNSSGLCKGYVSTSLIDDGSFSVQTLIPVGHPTTGDHGRPNPRSWRSRGLQFKYLCDPEEVKAE
jgi:hypothetical protein